MNTDSTRTRLLRAAAEEVARDGIKGASLRSIAERAEIRAASIFHYFPGGKDELIESMLAHIMEHIASRMTPTINAGTELPPVELIVQCTALLWDFMEEHPEYAGAMMREAFQPEGTILAVVRDNADRVLSLATAYLDAAQAAGQIAPIPARRLLMRIASFVMTFHGAPSLRQTVLGAGADLREERLAFLRGLRAELGVSTRVAGAR